MLFSLSNNVLLYETDGTGASEKIFFILLYFVIRAIKLIDRPHGYKAAPQDLTDVMRSIGLQRYWGDNNDLVVIRGL